MCSFSCFCCGPGKSLECSNADDPISRAKPSPLSIFEHQFATSSVLFKGAGVRFKPGTEPPQKTDPDITPIKVSWIQPARVCSMGPETSVELQALQCRVAPGLRQLHDSRPSPRSGRRGGVCFFSLRGTSMGVGFPGFPSQSTWKALCGVLSLAQLFVWTHLTDLITTESTFDHLASHFGHLFGCVLLKGTPKMWVFLLVSL